MPVSTPPQDKLSSIIYINLPKIKERMSTETLIYWSYPILRHLFPKQLAEAVYIKDFWRYKLIKEEYFIIGVKSHARKLRNPVALIEGEILVY